jgi:hypothetical protein
MTLPPVSTRWWNAGSGRPFASKDLDEEDLDATIGDQVDEDSVLEHLTQNTNARSTPAAQCFESTAERVDRNHSIGQPFLHAPTHHAGPHDGTQVDQCSDWRGDG